MVEHMRVKRVGVRSVMMISAVLGALIGVVVGVVAGLVAAVEMVPEPGATQVITLVTLAAVGGLVMAVFYAVLLGLAYGFGAWLYNVTARRFGGVVLELERSADGGAHAG